MFRFIKSTEESLSDLTKSENAQLIFDTLEVMQKPNMSEIRSREMAMTFQNHRKDKIEETNSNMQNINEVMSDLNGQEIKKEVYIARS